MGKPKFLIVDLNSILYRSCDTFKTFNYCGTFTGGLHGFILQFFQAIKQFKPVRTMIVCDGPPYLRKEIYPDYKGDRKKRRDPELSKRVTETYPLIREFLKIIGVVLWQYKKLEADDLIALVKNYFAGKNLDVIACSSDTDLYQLLSPKFKLYRGSKYGLFDYNDFKEKYPALEPQDWVTVQALQGGHNNLPGIAGVGIKTAIKILQDKERLEETLKKHGKDVGLNMRLTVLPIAEFAHLPLPRIKKPRISEIALQSFFLDLGITYTRQHKKTLQILCGRLDS